MSYERGVMVVKYIIIKYKKIKQKKIELRIS